jgi:hypothetical protein
MSGWQVCTCPMSVAVLKHYSKVTVLWTLLLGGKTVSASPCLRLRCFNFTYSGQFVVASFHDFNFRSLDD